MYINSFNPGVIFTELFCTQVNCNDSMSASREQAGLKVSTKSCMASSWLASIAKYFILSYNNMKLGLCSLDQSISNR